MWETIRGYLTFTRKERYGVLFLLLIISILFVLPYFFQPSVGDPDPAAYEKMKEGIRKFESRVMDSAGESVHHARYTDQKQYPSESFSEPAVKSFHPKMFYFDPNRLTGEQWQQLGLSERLSLTILHYIEKGGRFEKAEDLRKLYGLRNSDYEKLFPYVRIAKPTENLNAHAGSYAKTNYNAPAVKKADSFLQETPRSMEPRNPVTHQGKNYEITDINQADSAGWSRLPGIGTKLSSRIVHYREKLGGFYQVEQVGETFGLPDSVFQKIKPSLRMNTTALLQIDLNMSTKETLQAHPYIRWQLAKGIVEYRQQRGRFQSTDELLQLALMDQIKFEKLKPYIIVRP